MRAFQFIVGLAVLTCMSACLQSVNPLYTEKDLVRDEYLEGLWKGEGESWSFQRRDSISYTLTHVDKGDKAVFTAHLLQLGEYLFLDVFPQELMSDNYLYEATVFPVHTFFRIELNEGQLELMAYSGEDLEKEETLPGVKTPSGMTLLTASTGELQRFVLSKIHLFTDSLKLKKV